MLYHYHNSFININLAVFLEKLVSNFQYLRRKTFRTLVSILNNLVSLRAFSLLTIVDFWKF